MSVYTNHYKKQFNLLLSINGGDSKRLSAGPLHDHVGPQLGVEYDAQRARHPGDEARGAAAAGRRVVQSQHATTPLTPAARFPREQATRYLQSFIQYFVNIIYTI